MTHRIRTTISTLSLAAVIALASIAVAYGSQNKSSSGGSGPVKVGVEGPLTGQYAEFGGGEIAGVQAGAVAVNDGGGVMGRKLKLIIGDDASDPVDGISTATHLVSQGIVAEVGESAGLLKPMEHVFENAKLPMLTPGGDVSYDNTTDRYVWRLAPSDSALGVAMAVTAFSKGYRKAAIVFNNSTTSQSLQPYVKAEWHKLGGRIVASETLLPGQSSYQSEVQKVISAHPQVIFIEGLTDEAGTVFNEFRSLEQFNTPLIGTDDAASPQFTKAVGASFARAHLTAVIGTQVKSPASSAYLAAYHKVHRGAPLTDANYSYDGIVLLALAMDEAHSTSPAKIQAKLNEIGNGPGTVVYNYPEGVAAIKKGHNVRYIGASGPFNFNVHHNVFGPFAVVRLSAAGTYQTIRTFTPAQLAKLAK